MDSKRYRVFTTIILAAILLLGLNFSTFAQDTLEMEGTAIIGNKELPKVLYIVPWKSPQRIDITTPAISSIMDQALTPIDRRSFNRKIRYHKILFTELSEDNSSK